jgi:hypothetical protein
MLMASSPTSKDIDWQTGLKRKTYNLLFQETHLTNRNKHCLRVKGWKKIYQANAPENRQE